ncbi:MAG: inositol monophosphatase family protein [Alphaproteobacteria bacterium]
MIADNDRVVALIAETAAVDVMPRFRALAAHDVSEKGPGDLVTTADLAAEARLTKGLTGLLSGSVTVGEEAVAANPDRLRHLEREAPVWIIDPIDGTANFVAGDPRFAVMVSLVIQGRCEAGWIHDPVRGITVAAHRGDGAALNGDRVRLVPLAPIESELKRLIGAVYYRPRDAGMKEHFKQILVRFAALRTSRSAGQEYLALAMRDIHFAMFSRLNPWDHAAGALIHREAGGFNARLDGSPYEPDWAKDTVWTPRRGLLLAPDPVIWNTLMRAFFNEDVRPLQKT